MSSPDALTVGEALKLYFEQSGFDESTYTDRWVKLPVGPFHVYMPNIEARKIAVPLHDVDHVLTGYSTTWVGEWTISSYELGTGCGRYWAAWMINSQGVLAGGLLAPRKCIRAFARGRRSKGVYGYASYAELLPLKVAELRAQTTAPETSPTPTDAILFYAFYFTALAIHLIPLAIVLKLLFL